MRSAAVLVLGALPIVSSVGCALDQIGPADTISDAEGDQALPAIEPVDCATAAPGRECRSQYRAFNVPTRGAVAR